MLSKKSSRETFGARRRRRGEIPEAEKHLNGQASDEPNERQRFLESRDKSVSQLLLSPTNLDLSRSFSPVSLENRFINDSEINGPSSTLRNKEEWTSEDAVNSPRLLLLIFKPLKASEETH